MAKGGGGFFKIDGPFVRYGSLVFDLIFLNIVWILFGGIGPIMILLTSGIAEPLPAIVVWLLIFILAIHWGPATTALFYSLGKKQRGTDSYTFRDFWHAYKLNYKQALPVSLIITIIFVVLGYNMWLMYYNFSSFGAAVYIIFPLEVLVAIEVFFISLYIFPLLARFEMPTKDLFRYSFFMANKHLPFTLLCVALFAGCFALLYYVSLMLIMVIVSVYVYIAAGILERVFRNYMPSEDDLLEEEDINGFRLDEERQAIIDRYMGRASTSELDQGDVVRLDENGDVIHEEDYQVVKVDKNEEDEE